MKHLIANAMLAFAILTSCSKIEISPPANSSGTDSIPTKDSIPIKDTIKGVPAPFGIVDAPFIAVTIRDPKTGEYWIEKYKPDGSLRAYMLEKKYEQLPYNGYPGFTVNADRMAIGIDSSLYVVNMNTKEKTLIFKRKGNMMGFPTFNANGTKISFTMSPFSDPASSDLYVIDALPGAIPFSITGTNFNELIWCNPDFSNDGRFIAYTTWGTLNVYDLQKNEHIRVQNEYYYWNDYPVFSKDDTHIIFRSFKISPDSWNYSDLFKTEISQGAESYAVRMTNMSQKGLRHAGIPVFSGDGNTIYFLGIRENGTTNLYKMTPEGGNITLLASNLAENMEVIRMAYVEK